MGLLRKKLFFRPAGQGRAFGCWRHGLRPMEERFRLRSSSYDPTSRLRFEVGGRYKLKAEGSIQNNQEDRKKSSYRSKTGAYYHDTFIF